MEHFKEYINRTAVKSVTKQVVANTLTCVIVNLECCITGCEKVIVIADRCMVSYDNGYYISISKGDEIDTLLLGMISDF